MKLTTTIFFKITLQKPQIIPQIKLLLILSDFYLTYPSFKAGKIQK
jgi:hypothetical protein